MAKMQSVKFNSLIEFFDYLPDDQKEIVLVLREIILENVPDITEKLSFNVPFFFGKKSMFFIWPGAVAWGKKKKTGVQLGFTKGYLLTDKKSYLEKGTRKQVYLKTYSQLDEIEKDYEIIISLIKQACLVDKK